jgi:phosphotransferase system, enzyme I, PtsP
MSVPRRLLARLRETLAASAAPLQELVGIVAAELVTEVCSVYAMRPGDLLELAATEGLNPEAVGRTRLRVGEGIVGLCAATGQVMNLGDAQNHPAFAYRPELGEEQYAAMLAVPIRRAGRRLGVLVVQNRVARTYADDEVEVMETVAMVLADVLGRVGATDGAEEGVAATMPRFFSGTILVPGVVIGQVVQRRRATASRLLADDQDAEIARLRNAAQRVQAGLDELINTRTPVIADGSTRDIMEAYRLIATGDGWLRRADEAIRRGFSAEAAVQRVASDLRDRMRRVGDPFLRERLSDLEDAAGRLLSVLTEAVDPGPVPEGAILVARRLGPAELLDWHTRGIAGLAVEDATAGGHAAIIARALGLPSVAGVRGLIDALEPDDEAVLDGDDGQVVLRPEAELRTAYSHAIEARSARRIGWRKLRDRRAATADGTPVSLMMNVGLPIELAQLDETGADGIGLFRTEIAMLARGGIADVAEQASLYARALDAAGDRPVLFRTLDLGGDKLLPGTEVNEDNPAMGWRSIRIGLDRPAILRRQLRALLLAAGGRPLSVMFPMIATIDEFRRARALLLAEAKRVRPAPERLRIGTMLEVPALLWQLERLLCEADFVSIGSNDLQQFLFAADRGAAALAGRYDFISPPMLDMLDRAVAIGEAAGRPISLCGEAASRPLEALTLIGLGFRTLSMSAPRVLAIKELLAAADLPAFREVLRTIRRMGGDDPSLREPIAAWAKEHNLPA